MKKRRTRLFEEGREKLIKRLKKSMYVFIMSLLKNKTKTIEKMSKLPFQRERERERERERANIDDSLLGIYFYAKRINRFETCLIIKFSRLFIISLGKSKKSNLHFENFRFYIGIATI